MLTPTFEFGTKNVSPYLTPDGSAQNANKR